MYVWVGWWPSQSPDGEVIAHTGSAHTAFTERYKLTLQTAQQYAAPTPDSAALDVVVVRSGAEPEEFRWVSNVCFFCLYHPRRV